MPKSLLIALALSAAAPSAASDGTALRYAPAEGLRLVRTFEHRMERSLDELRLLRDGEEQELAEQPEIGMTNTGRVVVTDTIVAVDAGRPRKLVRVFDAIEQQVTESGPREVEKEGATELEGRSVTFTWSDEDGDFAVDWTDEEGDDALLEGLDEDMDLRGFLPPGEVAEGEVWDVDVRSFMRFTNPGGELGIDTDPPMREEELELRRRMRDAATGAIEAELTGERDVDGTRVGVIAVRAKIASEAELESETKIGTSVHGLNVGMDLEGELLWDLEAGHVRSGEIAGDVEFTFTSENRTSTKEGEPVVFSQELVFSGTASWAVAVELAE